MTYQILLPFVSHCFSVVDSQKFSLFLEKQRSSMLGDVASIPSRQQTLQLRTAQKRRLANLRPAGSLNDAHA